MDDKETLTVLKTFCSMLSQQLLKIIKEKESGYPRNAYECGQRDALIAMIDSLKLHSEREIL